MLNRPQEILFVTKNGLVQKDGYSARLGKGQFGIVDKGAPKTALGERVTTVLPSNPNDRLFELILGSSDLTVNRSQSNKAWRSIPFKLSDVVEIKVKTPRNQGSQDELLIGFDGINPDTAIVMQNGDNEVLDICIKGEAIGMLGYDNGEVTVKLYLEAPNEGAFTMHEIIEKGVERLLKTTLIGGVPLTQYVDITPINSTQGALVGTSYRFFELTVADQGRESDKALVQAQYPNYQVERKIYENGVSVYTILALANASIANYSIPAVDVAPNTCENCPTGYTASDAGFVSKVVINDAGADVVETIIDTIAGYVSAEKIGNENGIGTYLVVTSAELTSAQIATFVTANPTASVEFVGALSVICDNNASATTVAWVGGATGTAVSQTYEIQLADDECGNSRLAELQEAFPSLTIAVKQVGGNDVTGGCQTVYTTNVMSNPVFAECDPILLGLYFSEAPAPYQFTYWKPTAKTYNEDALMGIRVKGKVVKFAGDTEEYRYDIPTIYDPIRLAVSSEQGMVNESFASGRLGRFAVKMLSVASKPDNMGMDLRDREERAFVKYTDFPTHKDNNFARLILGEESLLKPFAQYVEYQIRIRTVRISGMFSAEVVENHTYSVVAEVGRHKDVEDVVNALAIASGKNTVYAYQY